MAGTPGINDLLRACDPSALHLELCDQYMMTPRFRAWQDGHREDPEKREQWWHPYFDAVSEAVGRGVDVRRARIVSEPMSQYIRFEFDVSFANIAAGERIRWLPREHASDLALPDNDFWLFDGRLVRFDSFSGDGDLVRHEHTEDGAVAKLCASAFEVVSERGTDHAEYRRV